MRGKVQNDRAKRTKARITPAYAGKSQNICNVRILIRDHPRLCGEKLRSSESFCSVEGSPPPMRGKAQNGSKRRHVHRITPAYAGKRLLRPFGKGSDQDHPRLCGEKLETRHDFTEKLGSPPPMRGKVLKKNGCEREIRITPAYAGKSFQLGDVPAVQKDHPRLCGEKRRSEFLHTIPAGSPPPMRGKVQTLKYFNFRKRITPAYAGKSCRKECTAS